MRWKDTIGGKGAKPYPIKSFIGNNQRLYMVEPEANYCSNRCSSQEHNVTPLSLPAPWHSRLAMVSEDSSRVAYVEYITTIQS